MCSVYINISFDRQYVLSEESLFLTNVFYHSVKKILLLADGVLLSGKSCFINDVSN